MPTREQLAAIDVEGFLRRLDGSLAAIADQDALAPLLPPDALAAARSDPRFAHADAMFRGTLRAALTATSLRDLPAEAHAHPEVQRRLWAAMDEMDTAALGVGAALEALTAEERADIGRALRAEPAIGASVLDALDAEAVKAGVTGERRAHLRKMGEHACFRLRQSTPGFIAEQTHKLGRARALSVGEAERYLAAQLGQSAFEQEREWQIQVSEAWRALLEEQDLRLAAPGDGGPPSADPYMPPAAQAPPPPANPYDSGRGKTVLKVGAWLFGLGLLSGLTGALLVTARDNDDVVLAGLFSFTAAAVLSITGLICLLVGAILRVRARNQAERTAAELG